MKIPLAFIIAKETLTQDDNISFKKITKCKIIDEKNKCKIRIWDGGNYGKTQCSNEKECNGICAKHNKAIERMSDGKWWLGLIDEQRPENPYHPISGYHTWKYDINGELINNEKKEIKSKIIKENKPPRKKRGRPIGSKNKK
tara:strand:+ start:99 stop:524 length:426 start_codon:yes stop_codon:yes gene_type:complete